MRSWRRTRPLGEPEPIELGDDIITTEYDLGEWTDDERHAVGTLLVRQHLPFRWDEHVLLVAHRARGFGGGDPRRGRVR